MYFIRADSEIMDIPLEEESWGVPFLSMGFTSCLLSGEPPVRLSIALAARPGIRA